MLLAATQLVLSADGMQINGSYGNDLWGKKKKKLQGNSAARLANKEFKTYRRLSDIQKKNIFPIVF